MLSWLLAMSLALAPQAPAAAASPVIAAPTPEEVFEVPAPLQAQLDAVLPPADASPRDRLERLVAFMSDPQGMGLQYQPDATLTVAQAYRAKQVNCLTWTLVFLALAPRAGLDAHAQEITQTLTWYQQDHTVYLNSHVNVAVKVGRSALVVDVSGDDMIALDAPFAISRQRLLSHYYNNRAVELLAAGDARSAQVHIARAIALAPEHADHWSNAGVVRARTGDLEGAVAAYTRALALDPRNASALFNAVILARRVGDTANEARLRARLARVQRHDPFHQFLRGLEFENQGALAQAIGHFRIATRLRPEEHRFHAALARACRAAGDMRCAAQALNRARTASRGDMRADYQAQLEALRADRLRHASGRSGDLQR